MFATTRLLARTSRKAALLCSSVVATIAASSLIFKEKQTAFAEENKIEKRLDSATNKRTKSLSELEKLSADERLNACLDLFNRMMLEEHGSESSLSPFDLLMLTRGNEDLELVWKLADFGSQLKASTEQRLASIQCRFRVAWVMQDLNKMEQVLQDFEALPSSAAPLLHGMDYLFAAALSYHLSRWQQATAYEKKAGLASPRVYDRCFPDQTHFHPAYSNVAELVHDHPPPMIDREQLYRQTKAFEVMECETKLQKIKPSETAVTSRRVGETIKRKHGGDIIITGAVATWSRGAAEVTDSGVASLKDNMIVMKRQSRRGDCLDVAVTVIEKQAGMEDAWHGFYQEFTKCADKARDTMYLSDITMKMKERKV